eukprot:gb/GFBE01063484.1/.p1 GENE.gb/GFBE01063484.1/~~gb/GFBE01063484.1/.p1  ORF type:complete len:530 (+),score=152.65 gb/GFBE01063484.1/:1-1590(+)
MKSSLKRVGTFRDAATVLVQADDGAVASTDHVDPEALFKMIKEVFNRFDADGSGYLDRQEMQMVFKTLLPSFTSKQINHFAKQLDKGGDGQVSHKEFMDFIKEDSDEAREAFAAIAKETSDIMVGRVREVFKRFDTDGGGFLDRDELSRVFRTFDSDFTLKDIDALCKELDRGGDGKVSRREFMAWIKRGSDWAKMVTRAILSQTGEAQEARIKKAFEKYDATGDGSLDIEELRRTLQVLGSFSNDEVTKVCADLDKSKDGEISFQEFANWIKDGSGTKEVMKAKAILAPSDNDGLEAVFYNFCGPGHADMDSKGFKRLCVDCELVDKHLDATSIDLIFSNPLVKPKAKHCIDFFQFEVAMELLADKKGVSKADIRNPILLQGCPKVRKSLVVATAPQLGNLQHTVKKKDPRTPSERRVAAILAAPLNELPGEESWRRQVDNTKLWRVFGLETKAGLHLKRLYNPPEMKRVDSPSMRSRPQSAVWASPFLTRPNANEGSMTRLPKMIVTSQSSPDLRSRPNTSDVFVTR